MMEFQSFERDGRSYEFIRIPFDKAPLVMIRGKKGFVMCGYLNIETSEKLGDLAIRVTGVKDLQTVLDAKVAQLTTRARESGIKEGDTVSDILHLI